MRRPIRAVLFDLDDTLFDHEFCSRCALEIVRSSYECFKQLAPDVLAHTHARILDELHPEVTSGNLDLALARTERFRRLFSSAGVDADPANAAAAAAAYRRRYEESWREVRGAAALLKSVRERGARVGVVSNNLLQEQRDKLRCCGLDAHVDVLVVSGETGISKPDPRIFEIALEGLGCRAEESVMIGDSYDADIAGAIAAGIRPIWFSRSPGAVAPEVEVITALEPTADVVARIFGDARGAPS
jgi:putative hydrolase of the HAD superfamily